MKFTVMLFNAETKCWLVRKYLGEKLSEDDQSNYVECEVFGADNEQQAIDMAIRQGSWA